MHFKEKNGTAKKANAKELSGWEKFIDENFDRERDTLCKYFNELYIRWMIDEKTEGDDLISYYIHHKLPNEKVVIISTDVHATPWGKEVRLTGESNMGQMV